MTSRQRRLDDAWNLVDMARGLIGLGKAHDLLGEALDLLSDSGRLPKGEDPQGLSAKQARAAAEGRIAQNTSGEAA